VTLFQEFVIYEIRQKNILELGRPQMTIWRMHLACCIPKVASTVICIQINVLGFLL